MATAVEPGSEPRTPTPASLPAASLIGAVYVVAAVAVVFYGVPQVWRESVSPQLGGFSFVDVALRLGVQLAAAVGLVWFGKQLLGVSPPKGVRAGIFLILLFAALIFLVWRFVALNLEGTAGMVVSGIVAAFLAYLALRYLTGKSGEARMVALEEQGWFHAVGYKRSLGQKVRRLTILGILLVGASGIYSLTYQGLLEDNWTLEMPFDMPRLVLLPDARFTVPLLLFGLTLWVAYRAVNVPAFGEFLIATEAEMNKVSWTPKKRLGQDTVVVLTTTLLMALFLLVVDLFWGWLLSRQTVGVLPAPATGKDNAGKAERAKW